MSYGAMSVEHYDAAHQRQDRFVRCWATIVAAIVVAAIALCRKA